VHARAALMFDDPFPNDNLIRMLIRNALLAAARGHMPDATFICAQLQQDAKYVSKITPLVSFLHYFFAIILAMFVCR
jgi:hypothetical protein